MQGFVARSSWRPSWKHPEAQRPEHGKREVPTAVFSLRAKTPARMVYVIYPYMKAEKATAIVEDLTPAGGSGKPVRVKITFADGRIDDITVNNGAAVTRTKSDGEVVPGASINAGQ